MNMNSLIIAADSARARIYRTGHPSAPRAPAELIEVDTVSADPRAAASSAAPFAREVAARVARFAENHFCNPVILTAARAVKGALLSELEQALPHAQLRLVPLDPTGLDERQLMRALEEREAFAPRHYPVQA